MTRSGYELSHVPKGPGAFWSCTGAIFVRVGKLRGSNFAQPPDGGVFGSEALPEGWCVTGAATLTRILTLTA